LIIYFQLFLEKSLGFLLVPLALFSLILLVIAYVYLAISLLRFLWRKPGTGRWGLKVALQVLGILLIVGSPYLLWKRYEYGLLIQRVPKPLEVASIEYRLEEMTGIGGPGDDESGFVVYRLTKESADWIRRQGSKLAEALPGGRDDWKETPIDDDARARWHRQDDETGWREEKPTVVEFLTSHGFPIPLEAGRDAEANAAIQTDGSFYFYRNSGAITIVDPKLGKVYFAFGK
jgi:hypothetical protein